MTQTESMPNVADKNLSSNDARQQLLSIIVPTYNEEENLEELCLRIDRSLQGIPYEVIVVDDSPEGGTRAVARELAGHRIGLYSTFEPSAFPI